MFLKSHYHTVRRSPARQSALLIATLSAAAGERAAMAPSEQSGYMKMLSGASGEPPPTLAKILEASKPLVRPLLALFDILAPIIAQGFEFGYAMYVKLPVDLFTALMGAGLCFCGGAYCASIAAVEAFRQCGWETTKAAILDVYAEFQRVKAAHDADEKKDADGDGVADVKRLTSSQLLQRKAALVAISIKDPEKLATALGGIWSAWLGVQGILRFEFAKTITLAISMVSRLELVAGSSASLEAFAPCC
eukprot:5848435-Pleurochrysis_carterae.AAC.1